MIFNKQSNSQILWESAVCGGAGLSFAFTESAGYGLKALTAGVGCALLPIAYKVSEYAVQQLRKKNWLSKANETKTAYAFTLLLSGASMWLIEGMRLQPVTIIAVQCAAIGALVLLRNIDPRPILSLRMV